MSGKEKRMNIIKESEFRKEIKTNPQNGYLFFGDEDYMKSFAVETAISAVSPEPSLSFFNEIRLDSFSYSPEALVDAMMPAPMMTDRKLILLSGLDFTSMKQSELDALCRALESLDEYDYNTLIINTSADRFDAGILPKRPSSALTKLSEHLTPVLFEKNTPAKLATWVGKHFEHNSVKADPAVCSLLIERCGRDMFKLASETDKLSFYVLSKGRSEVTSSDVINVAVPAAEYDAFALTNAIGSGKRSEALDILRDMKQRKLDPIMIISEITRTVCDMTSVALLAADGLTSREISDALKIHEYRISLIQRGLPSLDSCKHMLALCRSADLEIKGASDGFSIIERLICSI